MSGGTFKNLSFQELTISTDELENMAAYLAEQGFVDAALATTEIIAAMQKVDSLKLAIEDVWHDAEWVASCDMSPDNLASTVTKWRSVRKPLSPQQEKAARRLLEIELEAIQLRKLLLTEQATAQEQ